MLPLLHLFASGFSHFRFLCPAWLQAHRHLFGLSVHSAGCFLLFPNATHHLDMAMGHLCNLLGGYFSQFNNDYTHTFAFLSCIYAFVHNFTGGSHRWIRSTALTTAKAWGPC